MYQLWTGLTNLAFPPSCAGCGVSTDREGTTLCWDCQSTLTTISKPICSICGVPVHGRIDHDFICHDCTTSPPQYASARAAIIYNGIGRRLVTRFKYNFALWTEQLLVDLVENCVRFHYPNHRFDLICAVPLHSVKQRERGFNQAGLVAKKLSKRLKIPITHAKTLVRVKMTETQTRLTARQRLSNVLGAFEVRRPEKVAGKRLLLVDDVMTTGATVSVCSKALVNAGAERVDVVTVARGI